MNGINQPQSGFCLKSMEHVLPSIQEFLGEEVESSQGLRIAGIPLESAIQYLI